MLSVGGYVNQQQQLQLLAQMTGSQMGSPMGGLMGAQVTSIGDPLQLNPHAAPGAKICFDFLNRGQCSRTQSGKVCSYRHLPPNHPEAIADRIKSGKPVGGAASNGFMGGSSNMIGGVISPMGLGNMMMAGPSSNMMGGMISDPMGFGNAMAAGSSMGTFPMGGIGISDPLQLNPNAAPDAKICFNFLNRGRCARQDEGKICSFRHLHPSHPEAIADKIRSGKAPGGFGGMGGGLPLPAVASMGGMGGMPLQLAGGMPLQGVDGLQFPTVALNAGFCRPHEANPTAEADAKVCFDFLNRGWCSRENRGLSCAYRHLLPTHPENIADKLQSGKITDEEAEELRRRANAVVPGQVTQGAGGGINVDSMGLRPHEANPHAAADAKICFDFLNRGGQCSRAMRGMVCRFRHLLPSHPEAIADKGRRDDIVPVAAPDAAAAVAEVLKMAAAAAASADRTPAK